MSELKPYAEPVAVPKLVQGDIYFIVTYVDNHMLVPDIKTLVFLGRDVANEGDDLLYFQDIDSYVKSGAFPNNASAGGELYTCANNQLNNIFELDNMRDELRRCAMRRSGRQGEPYDFLI
jgi:hypothetical protein